MKKRIILPLLLGAGMCVDAQQIVQRDPVIAGMVAEVRADSLESYIHRLVSFGTRSTLSSTTDKKKGIGAARNWVLEQFKSNIPASGGRLSVALDTITLPADGKRIDVPVNLGNVMATLRGTDPQDKRVYVVTGHLDSRATDVMDRTIDAPGANDDGSGVAALIEMVRVMSRHPYPATIVFVAVSGEEQGLQGSDHLADRASKENWQVDAMLNNDMIGQNSSSETDLHDNTRVRVFSEGIPATADEKQLAFIRQVGMENDGNARQLARYIKETGERYVDNLDVMLIYRNDRFLRGGDHTPFVKRGMTAVRITDMYENYDHQHQTIRKEKGVQYGDLPEFMDFEYLRKNTALNLSVLASLATAPSKPQDVKLDVKQLTNYSRLYWTAPQNGKPKGYYVMMRETSSPVWQKKFFTTATELTIPYSKDNYLFGVQAVGENSAESQAVFPGIGR
ncbi:M28 family metallopeptidase [Chitinophaga sp. Cy-1792]|uniref:M28 family metallopeptidase n=1 Tax=Chitinophaga sp. Cy-1792 TaxID=2608339 RepID=UPI00141DC881|nr:M28 family metallopeptidase [Chitinophaga sp. Cy-1792]NIG52932.1 M20/M25/M40 family metallo-hydrolase [Chitinophaga sp. Cy-1792]